jgi:isopropylmalate/homocitrate/citramalate synthase
MSATAANEGETFTYGHTDAEIGLWVWHVHHEVLLEKLFEPLQNRVAYIEVAKPSAEVATRLRLLKIVRNQAAAESARQAYDAAAESVRQAYDAAVKPARQAYNAAVETARQASRQAYNAAVEQAYDAAVKSAQQAYDAAVKSAVKPAWQAYDAARQAYDAAVEPAEQAYNAAVEELHTIECTDCPWNGHTIFP